jgi:hypothetical protein
MCSACGILSSDPEWMDRVDNPNGIGHSVSLTSAADRQRRFQYVNLLLEADGSQASTFGAVTIVRGATGKTEIVQSLMHVWSAADRVGSYPVDILDPTLLNRLAAS